MPTDDTDAYECELADAESEFLGCTRLEDRLTSASALERLGDAYANRVCGHKMDNLRRALLAFRYALCNFHKESHHATRLCAKLSSVLAQSALLRQKKIPAPPAYDPVTVTALSKALPLPPHARSLPSFLVNVHNSPNSESTITTYIHENYLEDDDDEEYDYDRFDPSAERSRSTPSKDSPSLYSTRMVDIDRQGWPSVDDSCRNYTFAKRDLIAASLCTGEHSFAMYASSPDWSNNVQDAEAYLKMRVMQGILYDYIQQEFIGVKNSDAPVVRGARGTPPNIAAQRSNTLLALCLNALEPVLFDSSVQQKRKSSAQFVFTTFAQVPPDAFAPSVAGLKVVIAGSGRTFMTDPGNAEEAASSLAHLRSETVLQNAHASGAKIPDVERLRAFVSLCHAYVRLHGDVGDAALDKARSALEHVTHELSRLREHWCTQVVCKGVACAPIVEMLDDLADDVANIAAVTRIPSNTAFSRCVLS